MKMKLDGAEDDDWFWLQPGVSYEQYNACGNTTGICEMRPGDYTLHGSLIRQVVVAV
jgi:hypothetical protein